jgi:putative hydrolase of the HAD superfamily
MYKAAYEVLGIPANQCLYVGDGFGQELTGAARLGLHPVLISDVRKVNGAPDGDGATWTGDRIRSLTELLAIIG